MTSFVHEIESGVLQKNNIPPKRDTKLQEFLAMPYFALAYYIYLSVRGVREL
jgi:hypothetical protein